MRTFLTRTLLVIVLTAPLALLAAVVLLADALGVTQWLVVAVALVVAVGVVAPWLYKRRLKRDHVWSGNASTEKVVQHSLARTACKRVLDLAVAGGLVIALAPSMLMIAAAVKLDDRGPALFRQSRVGRHGRTFNMYKFRTMAVGSEHQHSPARGVDGQSLGPLFNVERDPRSTALGHVLRRTGLDELPQLFNVIQGTMSLVGPRPAMPSEVIDFDSELRKRELILPGITGLWQALARNNPSLDVYRQLDHYYMQNRTILADIAILGLTIGQMMRRLFRGIAESTSDTL